MINDSWPYILKKAGSSKDISGIADYTLYTHGFILTSVFLINSFLPPGLSSSVCSNTWHTSVFNKLIWHTIGPKSFVFGTAQFSVGPVVQLIMIILSVTALTLYLAQNVFSMLHALTIFESM